MDSEQELNRRRAEWAGISLVGVPMGCEPNFPQSLDAIFKLLVPKLDDCELKKGPRFWRCIVSITTKGCWLQRASLAQEPALALCKAIDKLIDSEKKDE